MLDVVYSTFVSSFPMNSSDDPANKLLDRMLSGTDTRMKPVTVEPAMRVVDSACSVTYFDDELPMVNIMITVLLAHTRRDVRWILICI